MSLRSMCRKNTKEKSQIHTHPLQIYRKNKQPLRWYDSFLLKPGATKGCSQYTPKILASLLLP